MGKKKFKHFTRRDLQLTNKRRKNAQHFYLSEKCKLKPGKDATTHPLEWLTCEKLTPPPSVGKDVE